jgi:hypothetical protein
MLILFNAPIYNKVEKENFKKNPQMGIVQTGVCTYYTQHI